MRGRRGLPTLGSLLGSVANRRCFLQGKIATVKKVTEGILLFPRQSTQILLRFSMLTILRHLPHTLDPNGLERGWQDISTALLSVACLPKAIWPDHVLDPSLMDLSTSRGTEPETDPPKDSCR